MQTSACVVRHVVGQSQIQHLGSLRHIVYWNISSGIGQRIQTGYRDEELVSVFICLLLSQYRSHHDSAVLFVVARNHRIAVQCVSELGDAVSFLIYIIRLAQVFTTQIVQRHDTRINLSVL